ncbi:MAG: hypothetical protein K6U03_09730 [Firmicutes bacterium]|nr:hypothetical protein [Bacillota bacterium]
MHRIVYVSILGLVLVAMAAAPALAAPDFAVGRPGSYYVFGEFGSDIRDYGSSFLIGSGFALDRELTLGVQIQPLEDGVVLGAFGTYWRQPFAFNADLRLSFPGLAGKLDAIYLLESDRFKAGVGMGFLVNADGSRFFIELTGSLPIEENLALYLAVETFPNTETNLYHFGLTYML